MVTPFLFAALIASEPSITYAEVEAMVTFRTAPVIIAALIDAYKACMAEPETQTVPLAKAE